MVDFNTSTIHLSYVNRKKWIYKVILQWKCLIKLQFCYLTHWDMCNYSITMMRNVHNYHEYKIFYKIHLDTGVIWNEFSISRLPYPNKCALFFDMSCYNFGICFTVLGEKVVYIILKLFISYLTMLATLLHQVYAILFWTFWLFECINMMSWRETLTKKKITVEAKFNCFQENCS